MAHDLIIIGAGHNGLVTAFYLAKAGLRPLVLERRHVVGGAAITDEFHPGFKCSTLAHNAGPVAAGILGDMQLERHGLKVISHDGALMAPLADGRALRLFADTERSAREIAAFSKKDAERYPEFERTLSRLAAVIARVAAQAPPSLDGSSWHAFRDGWALLGLGREVRHLGKRDLYRLLRWTPMAVADLASEWFESEPLRALVAARGIFGAFLGPRSAGSAALLLLRAAADPRPAGSLWIPEGGMGSLTQAMARAAQEAGAEIRTGAEVRHIVVQDGRARGVVLAGGEEIAARRIVSSADPQRTLLGLVGPAELQPQFISRLQHYRCRGVMAKLNLALAGLPSFRAIQNGSTLSPRLHIGPDINYLERALDDAKYGRFSREPYLDVLIPSLLDPSLAPPGRHVMSVCVQFAPYQLRGGNWQQQRDALGRTVLDTLACYAPNIRDLVLEMQLITPLDMEETYGLTGGHIFHGELSLDQVLTMRPLLGWARYRTPIAGLYLCGSGTHPGNGLTGLSGRNAAREILKDR